MRKNYVKICALMAVMIAMLGGCGGSFPDMTQEEEQAVGEYAAKLLLKYDANNRSRLVSREEVAIWESELEQEVLNTIPEPTQEGMEPVDDTPVIEIGQETADGTTGSLEEFYGLADGIKIIYQGNEICDSYSQTGDTNAHFALDAAEGNKLVVLNFRIENQAQAKQNIDLLSQSAVMHVTLNGSDKYNVLTTMLMEDMSTYMGEVPAGGNVDVVLLVETDSETADNISSVSLNLKNDSKTCTIQLQ